MIQPWLVRSTGLCPLCGTKFKGTLLNIVILVVGEILAELIASAKETLLDTQNLEVAKNIGVVLGVSRV